MRHVPQMLQKSLGVGCGFSVLAHLTPSSRSEEVGGLGGWNASDPCGRTVRAQRPRRYQAAEELVPGQAWLLG